MLLNRRGDPLFGRRVDRILFEAYMLVLCAKDYAVLAFRTVRRMMGLEKPVVVPAPGPELYAEREALIEAWSAYADREQILGFNVIQFWYSRDNGDGTSTMFWRRNVVGSDRVVPSDLLQRTRRYERAIEPYLVTLLREDESIRLFLPLDYVSPKLIEPT